MKKNKIKNIDSKSFHFDHLKHLVTAFLKENPEKSFTGSQILKAIHSKNKMEDLAPVFKRLIQTKKIADHKNGRVQYIPKALRSSSEIIRSVRPGREGNVIEGRLEIIKSGAAYLVSDQSAVDIYIPEKYLGGAIHGDIVQVAVQPTTRRKPEGKVAQILRRETSLFVGTVRLRKSNIVVIPSSLHHRFEIHIAAADSLDAAEGDKVIVQITKWQEGTKYTRGKITQIMTPDAVIDNEMQAILINNGFPLKFSSEAISIAEQVANTMKDGLDWPDRRDFRSITTFTIDPETAKDFDDALSYATVPNDLVEIGVHIADASHYLQEGTVLDQEAYAKSTSVYLVDRALPMLPEILSSEVCSLNPHTDRLTFSVVFTIDISSPKIVHTWIGKSIIRSDHRFTYENAQEILNAGIGIFYTELNQLNQLAKKFRKKRFEQGSIGFDSPEYKFKLDPISGKPISVHAKEHIETHALIEEFMLLANKAVAEYIHTKEQKQDIIPFVYRVHDLPDLDKLNDLALFAKEMGFEMKMNTPKEITKSLNRLYEESLKNDALKMLQPLGIRAMAKAEYSTNNIGHYGLAFDLYSHFTSPIRRYSDILAHRILFQNLNVTYRVNKKRLDEQCKHISNQERKAMDAERESVKYFQMLFIQDHIGAEFTGVIAGMIERGIFIDLDENHVEGFVPFDQMNERFVLADNRLKVFGRTSGMILSMGDKVKVKVESVDTETRRIELRFVQKL